MNKRIEQNKKKRPLEDTSSSALNILKKPDSTQSGKPSDNHKKFNLFEFPRSVKGIQSDKKERPSQNKLRRKDADNLENVVLSNLRQLKDLPPFAEEAIKQEINNIDGTYETSRKTIYDQYEKALLNSSGKPEGAQKLEAERDSKLKNAKEERISKFQRLNDYVLAGTQDVVAGLADMIADRRTEGYLDNRIEKAEQNNKRLKDEYSASSAELDKRNKTAWELYQKLIPMITEMARITTLLGREEAGSDRPLQEAASSHSASPLAQLDLSPIEEHLKLNDPVSLASLPRVTEAALAKLTQLSEIKEGSAQDGENITEIKALAAQLKTALLERNAVLKKMGDIQAGIESNNAYKELYTTNPTAKVADLEQKQIAQSAILTAVKAELTTAMQRQAVIAEERIRNREEQAQTWQEVEGLYQEIHIIRSQGDTSIAKALSDADHWRSKIDEAQIDLKEREKKYNKIDNEDERTRLALAEAISEFTKKIEINSEDPQYSEEVKQSAAEHKAYIEEYQGSLERLDKARHDHRVKMDLLEKKYGFKKEMLDQYGQNLRVLEQKYLEEILAVLNVEGKKNDIQAQADVIDKALHIAKDHDKAIDAVYDRFLADARGIVKTEHARHLHFLGMRDRARQLSWMAFWISLGGGANDILQQIAVSGYMPLMGMLLR